GSRLLGLSIPGVRRRVRHPRIPLETPADLRFLTFRRPPAGRVACHRAISARSAATQGIASYMPLPTRRICRSAVEEGSYRTGWLEPEGCGPQGGDRMPRRTQGRAFTLIELLVVIAIIAILAAILFPVFAQARDKARQSACLSNTKQIALGIAMYRQDWDG